MQPLDVMTLINMRATICMLILSGSNCRRKPLLRKFINGTTLLVKIGFTRESLLPGTGEGG